MHGAVIGKDAWFRKRIAGLSAWTNMTRIKIAIIACDCMINIALIDPNNRLSCRNSDGCWLEVFKRGQSAGARDLSFAR